MINLRTYGRLPPRCALIHGGPGAPGCMAPVARELSGDMGVLEPLQRADSLEGQVEELREVLLNNAEPPVTLVGSSWGALLSFLCAAHYPDLCDKLILIGSGVFEEKYSKDIMKTRFDRMNEKEFSKANNLLKSLQFSKAENKDKILDNLGKILTKVDAFDPITLDIETLEIRFDIFQNVWSEFSELRRSEKLMEIGHKIKCPITVIHGDYDPHPLEGITTPLSKIRNDIKVYLLKNCGHLPWIERQAKGEFYTILRKELAR